MSARASTTALVILLSACASTTGSSGEPAGSAGSIAKPAPTASIGQYQLNYGLEPIHGSTTLASGFAPDPFSVEVTAGGTVNAEYVGADCHGYPTAEPSFSVTYEAGSATLLRFYVDGPGDTAMIINAPNGTFVCGDDSFGTRSPTIDFEPPEAGRYDVWVGPFEFDQRLDTTLKVTEHPDNHP